MPTVNNPDGTYADVNGEHRMLTQGVNSSLEHHVNHHEKQAYNLIFSQSPTAADDCIGYIKNSADDDMILEGVWIGFKNATAVDAEVYFKKGPTGTRNTATDITPANANAGASEEAEGDFEKGADLDGGGVTLAGGVETDRFLFADIQNLTSKFFNFEQDIIIQKNKTFTFWATDAGATYYFTLIFNYHHQEIG